MGQLWKQQETDVILSLGILIILSEKTKVNTAIDKGATVIHIIQSKRTFDKVGDLNNIYGHGYRMALAFILIHRGHRMSLFDVGIP